MLEPAYFRLAAAIGTATMIVVDALSSPRLAAPSGTSARSSTKPAPFDQVVVLSQPGGTMVANHCVAVCLIEATLRDEVGNYPLAGRRRTRLVPFVDGRYRGCSDRDCWKPFTRA